MKTRSEKAREIADRCGRLIKASGLPYSDIASTMNCSEESVRQYARGRTPVPLPLLEAFCIIMKCQIGYVITGRNCPVLSAYQAADVHKKSVVDTILGISRDEIVADCNIISFK